MKGVDNSFVVVQRRIEFFYYFSFHACGYAMPAACGDLLFFSSKKKEASGVQLAVPQASSKMPPSNAGRLAQRKLLKWLNIMRWPAQLECHKNIRCETVSRAVRDGFG